MSLVAGIVAILWLRGGLFPTSQRPAGAPSSSAPLRPDAGVSPLGEAPDWPQLERFQGSISRREFVSALEDFYSLGEAWRGVMTIGRDEAKILRGGDQKPFVLNFATSEEPFRPPRTWRSPGEIPPSPDPQRPLLGLRVAIDPGHIGGRWAVMEGRHFVIKGSPPVREGEMTLLVAKHLQVRLEELGATVFLTRRENRPVTRYRPDDFLDDLDKGDSESAAMRRTANKYFYRLSEIRSRAHLLRSEFRPDLCLCLHFNAEAWGDPANPTLSDENHFHLLINGAYGGGELRQEDQRYEMLCRLLERRHQTELALALPMARYFARETGLPAYRYTGRAMVKSTRSPYVWKRNLLANRIFPCPVLYFEPYVMNTTVTFKRVMAGDYPGLRKVAGKMRPSIYREYASAVASGLVVAIDAARR